MENSNNPDNKEKLLNSESNKFIPYSPVVAPHCMAKVRYPSLGELLSYELIALENKKDQNDK